MISNYISAIWEGGAPAMGNHLWQSTLCVVIAGLLALALRKNSARARYAIWLAASLKFLLPFSLLVALGGQFAKPRVVTEIQKQVYVIVRHGGEPLSAAVAISPAVHPAILLPA